MFGGGSQGGCEQRIEVLYKFKKKIYIFFFFFWGGAGSSGGVRVDVSDELKFR